MRDVVVVGDLGCRLSSRGAARAYYCYLGVGGSEEGVFKEGVQPTRSLALCVCVYVCVCVCVHLPVGVQPCACKDEMVLISKK